MKRKARGHRRRGQRGAGFFDDVKNFVKKHRILSSLGDFATPIISAYNPVYGSLAQHGTDFLRQQGYGRHIRKPRPIVIL